MTFKYSTVRDVINHCDNKRITLLSDNDISFVYLLVYLIFLLILMPFG